ncbi:uncharacterized protein LOC143908537 [Temnothorax americanus]|uniref:uncharacterized protein LOC143908537 n=1 Tax=Temnothorax americanus TaxID=1964332 RepID=UPI004068F567
MRVAAILLAIILHLAEETTSEQPPYEMTAFTAEPGIYYEKIGQLQQTKATWKMAIRIDVTALNIRYQQFQENLARIEEICNHAIRSVKNTCQITLQTIKRENSKTTRNLEQLRTIYRSPVIKRGLIDAVGQISKTLFGTMDAEDAKVINEQIQLLNNQQQTLQHAAKNQLKIINATIGHMEKLEQTLSYNENLMANVTRKLEEQLIYREGIDEQLLVLTAILNDLTTDINDITDYLTHAKHNILLTRVLPTEKIIVELREATSHIDRRLNFPFKIQAENWNSIQKYLDVNAYYDNSNIYTILAFPLIAYPMYEIIKITPVPVHNSHNVFTFLEPSHTLLGINRENHNYVILKENDLNKCTQENTKFTCAQNLPVYFITANAPTEIQLFVKTSTHIENRKQRHIISNVTFWIAVSEPQTWLFSTPKTINIVIQCNELPEIKIKIEKTGKITLRDSCKLTTPDIYLETTNRVYNKYVKMYLPEFNITDIIEKSITVNNKIESDKEIKLEPIIKDPTELMKISLSLEEIQKEMENNQPSIFTNKNIIYSIGSTVTIVIVISIIAVIIYVIKKK